MPECAIGTARRDRYGRAGETRRYHVRLIAEFSFVINETVEARPRATRAQIEEVIDRDWWWISGSTDVLLESSWVLENFEGLPPETH